MLKKAGGWVVAVVVVFLVGRAVWASPAHAAQDVRHAWDNIWIFLTNL